MSDPLKEFGKAVAKAYKKAVRELHPDLHPNDPEKLEQFHKLSLAYSSFVEYVQTENLNIVEVNYQTIVNESENTPFSSNWWDRFEE